MSTATGRRSDDRVKGQWEGMLQFMLLDHRQNNPDDRRTDRELLTSVMDHLAETGTIQKRDGKYIIGEITP